MHTLKTSAKKINDTDSLVYWKVGENANGCYRCILDKSYKDSEIISELIVIRKLLVEDNIFNRKSLYKPSGLELKVSKGAIKKLVLRRSTKTDVQPFAFYYEMMLPGLVPIVENAPMDFEIDPVDFYIDTAQYTSSHLKVDTPVMGEVFVTFHAVERLKERIVEESGECKYPLDVMIKRLTNPEIEKVVLPENVIAHKQKKYGVQHETFEAWKHPTSTFTFAIVRNNETGKRTVVTVYIK